MRNKKKTVKVAEPIALPAAPVRQAPVMAAVAAPVVQAAPAATNTQLDADVLASQEKVKEMA